MFHVEHEDALRRALVAELDAVGLQLPPEMLDRAVYHAVELLRWNGSAGLTRITEPREVARRHFVESIVASELLPVAEGPTVLDVGSGGGFPGLALRLRRPDARVELVERRHRKAAFLQHVARSYPPPRTLVHAVSLEDLATQMFDVVILRAVRVDVKALAPFLAPGARLVLFRGTNDPAEQELASRGLVEIDHRLLPRSGRVEAWTRTD